MFRARRDQPQFPGLQPNGRTKSPIRCVGTAQFRARHSAAPNDDAPTPISGGERSALAGRIRGEQTSVEFERSRFLCRSSSRRGAHHRVSCNIGFRAALNATHHTRSAVASFICHFCARSATGATGASRVNPAFVTFLAVVGSPRDPLLGVTAVGGTNAASKAVNVTVRSARPREYLTEREIDKRGVGGHHRRSLGIHSGLWGCE